MPIDGTFRVRCVAVPRLLSSAELPGAMLHPLLKYQGGNSTRMKTVKQIGVVVLSLLVVMAWLSHSLFVVHGGILSN